MNIALVLVKADGKSREAKLRRAHTVIGRQTDCQLRIPSASVSRHHCEVIVGESKVSIRDLGSSNGTYVNRKRVQQAELAPGDLLAVGEMVFVLRVNGKPDFIDAEECYEDGVVMPVLSPGKSASGAPAIPAVKGKGELEEDANEGSSVGDFDFLDEEDMKRQPKL